MKRSNYLHTLYLILLITVGNFSCQKETPALNQSIESNENNNLKTGVGIAENDMVMYWNQKIATVLGVGMNQPTRARFFAIMHIAIHDALNSIKPKFDRYALINEREKFASPDAAVASAAYHVIKGLNRQGTFPVETWYNVSLSNVAEGDSKLLGIELGKKAATSIVSKRSNDGFSLVLSTSTNPPNGTLPGEYRSTNLLNLRYIPNWGAVVKPFVTNSNSQFRPEGPYQLGSAEYAADFNEVKSKGVRGTSTRSEPEEVITRFWSENRPSLIWNELTRQIIADKKLDAWRTARLFAMLHTAMADGINTSMAAAYHFYFWRPETAIRQAAFDGNESTLPNATWLPFLTEAPSTIPAANFVSPPVPEYPSSHAMYGGVATEVLRSFFETDKIAVDLTSAFLPGTTLHYTSILKTAKDNSIGKIHAGWFFRKSVEDGEQMGRLIANYVMNNSFKSAE